MNQSFVSAASNLMNAITSTNPGSSLQKWTAMEIGVLMPNIIRQFNDDWIDNQKYTSSSFFGQVANSLGVTKALGTQPALNYFGEPITSLKVPVVGGILGKLGGDELLAKLDDLGIMPTGYSLSINGIPMTDVQKTQFVSQVGPQIKNAIEQILPEIQQLNQDGHIEESKNLMKDTVESIVRPFKMSFSAQNPNLQKVPQP
jgi:hypothetical protein